MTLNHPNQTRAKPTLNWAYPEPLVILNPKRVLDPP